MENVDLKETLKISVIKILKSISMLRVFMYLKDSELNCITYPTLKEKPLFSIKLLNVLITLNTNYCKNSELKSSKTEKLDLQ
mmetsp:Transcript_2445/g.224  ORF Transcript_2445/g.224 Transcript_2445/m.224 type:complete len:82 (-) Transcript_2445:70-315(-)